MTDLTREQIEALLDVTTPGNWLASPDGNGEWGVDTDDGWGIATVAASAGLKGDNGFTEGNARLIAAAPDLARQLLATMTALVEAQAAQAVVVEKAAAICNERGVREEKDFGLVRSAQNYYRARDAIRSLADPTGVKLLEEMRAERDRVASINVKHCEAVNTLLVDGARLEDRATTAEAQLAEAHTREAGLKSALSRLLRRDEINTCQHEDTYRGGAIWEICHACGSKWADDVGGKPDWTDPPEWVAARAALSAAPTGEESNDWRSRGTKTEDGYNG